MRLVQPADCLGRAETPSHARRRLDRSSQAEDSLSRSQWRFDVRKVTQGRVEIQIDPGSRKLMLPRNIAVLLGASNDLDRRDLEFERPGLLVP